MCGSGLVATAERVRRIAQPRKWSDPAARGVAVLKCRQIHLHRAQDLSLDGGILLVGDEPLAVALVEFAKDVLA